MLVREENIASVIPQREPFIMVSNLLAATPDKFESDFVVNPQNIFVKDGILQEAALIENMAQTCAAGFGFLNNKAGTEPMTGFIGAISKLKIYILPSINTKLNTKVVVTHRLENIFLVKGEVFQQGVLLAGCEMKIVVN